MKQLPTDLGPAKAYPLEIESVGEDTYIVMSKGHHDAHAFMAAVREAGYDWPLGMPKHVWMRAVPTRQPYMRCLYFEADAGARGAFPCTYAWEAYGEDRYEAIEVLKREQEKAKPTDCGHGHVYPRADGVKARCGGPGLCKLCSRDAALRQKGKQP